MFDDFEKNPELPERSFLKKYVKTLCKPLPSGASVPILTTAKHLLISENAPIYRLKMDKERKLYDILLLLFGNI